MSLDITPTELDLPRKFDRFRTFQLTALERIAQSKKKVVMCQAPPGTGKTLLMAALGKYLKKRLVYTCHTKQLQQQVKKDFSYAVVLKGRANYRCLKAEVSCAECTSAGGNKRKGKCKSCQYLDCDGRPPLEALVTRPVETVEKCPCEGDCPYLKQKRRAKMSELAVLNMPFFLNEANAGGDFSGWPWVILDEGDLTENALMSFIEVRITTDQIEKLELSAPRAKTVASAWVEWAAEAIPAVENLIIKLDESEDWAALREKTDMERLLQKLTFLIRQNLDSWVFLPEENSWTFKPVFVSGYAGGFLWEHGEHFLVMSGTIISSQQTARDLGLKEEDVDFIDIPSTFPAERRPIHFIPSANMSHANKETAWPQIVRQVDELLERHSSEKVLVHTVSYPLARYIVDNSRHKDRLVEHDSEHRVSALEDFKADSRPLVMVSPSMDRGVDLPYELCRAIILVKVPYPNLGDPQISRRLYSSQYGQTWYAVQTIRTIIQATGRGMRAEDDYCVSYILDEQFRRLYKEYYDFFPKWWREALTPYKKSGV